MEFDKIWIQNDHWEAMRFQVEKLAPEEACGLIAGSEGRSIALFPVENILHSPVRYRMAAEEQVRVILEIEARGWDLLAIYHSHPGGPAVPSPTDIAESAYPESVYLIWSPECNEWSCRGFYITDSNVKEIQITLYS